MSPVAPWTSRIVRSGVEAPEALLANPMNWRVHPKAQQQALAAVLDEVGWVQQVIVNERTGHVVDGHLRVSLAISRQEGSIPVLYVDLSEEEEALVLASLDPLAGMAVTDEEMFAELVGGLEVTDDALAELLGLRDGKALQGDPDAVPEVPADPITKPGDLWVLGEHRLLCGDAYVDLDRLLDGAKVGCVLTDPPYGINLDTDYSQIKGSKKSMLRKTTYPASEAKKSAVRHGEPSRVLGRDYRPVEGDARPFDAAVFAERFAHCKEQFWFGANYYRRTLPGDDLDGAWLVWDKRPGAANEGSEGLDEVFGSAFELIWSRQSHQQRMIRKQWSGFTARNTGMERAHPTEKPVDVLTDILGRWAPRGCVVVDPFGGVGTTLIAAEQTSRIGYLMEIDPAYCDVIVKRWENLTGGTAVLDG